MRRPIFGTFWDRAQAEMLDTIETNNPQETPMTKAVPLRATIEFLRELKQCPKCLWWSNDPNHNAGCPVTALPDNTDLEDFHEEIRGAVLEAADVFRKGGDVRDMHRIMAEGARRAALSAAPVPPADGAGGTWHIKFADGTIGSRNQPPNDWRLIEMVTYSPAIPTVRGDREAIARAIFKNRQHLSDEDIDKWFKTYADNPEGIDHFRMAIWRAYSDADAVLSFPGGVQSGAGERVSFPRQWVEQIRDGLFAMGKLPSGPLGDWAFLFREQLNDALSRQPDQEAVKSENTR